MFAILLSVFLGFQSTGSLEDGLSLAMQGRHAESEAIMMRIDPRRVSNDMYNFVRMLNNFALNKKGDALKYGREVDESFTKELPRRYRSLAYLMKNELENWGKNGELDDIERDMRHIAGRLGNGQGGTTTQKLQKEVVEKLDKLIKEQEGKNGGGEESAQKDGNKQLPGQQPAPDSTIMGGSGQGKVDEKQLRQVAESWGTLPPEKRAKIVSEITRDVPAKYKHLIDEYFKSLNRAHGYK